MSTTIWFQCPPHYTYFVTVFRSNINLLLHTSNLSRSSRKDLTEQIVVRERLERLVAEPSFLVLQKSKTICSGLCPNKRFFAIPIITFSLLLHQKTVFPRLSTPLHQYNSLQCGLFRKLHESTKCFPSPLGDEWNYWYNPISLSSWSTAQLQLLDVCVTHGRSRYSFESVQISCEPTILHWILTPSWLVQQPAVPHFPGSSQWLSISILLSPITCKNLRSFDFEQLLLFPYLPTSISTRQGTLKPAELDRSSSPSSFLNSFSHLCRGLV